MKPLDIRTQTQLELTLARLLEITFPRDIVVVYTPQDNGFGHRHPAWTIFADQRVMKHCGSYWSVVKPPDNPNWEFGGDKK